MASPDVLKAVAKMFLAPEHIDGTVELLEARFRKHTDDKEYDRALAASQLLLAAQKLRAKQNAPPKPATPAKAAKK